jgi:ribonuclease G
MNDIKKILINSYPWQTRVAVLRGNKLQDIYFDSPHKVEIEKAFFKATVSKVLPGIQTAFVDIGQEKAGFLHISEIDRALAAEKMAELRDELHEDESFEHVVKQSMTIEKIFKENEHILVQVIKEPVYEKGAKLTTCFTLPGKFVVLMPNIPQTGISKKIESRNERARLKEIITKELPSGMGAIIRTTAEDRPAKDIQRDLSLLISAWRSIKRKFNKAEACEKIHEDLPPVLRAVREHLDDDVEGIYVDNLEHKRSILKFIKHFMPEQIDKIKYHDDPTPIFDKFKINEQIEEALQRKVNLRSGGSLIVETTEAMTVIDVNTGRYTGKSNLEETILKTNLEAAEEVIRQLRLRNIGGLIVIDFIDMSNSSNKQKLSRFLEKISKERDKLQSVALKVSEFGLVQMTRKRTGKTLVQQLTHSCPMCNSRGFVKSISTLSNKLLREFYHQITKEKKSGSIVLTISNKIFDFLVHNEFKALLKLEKEIGRKIILESNECFDENQFTFTPAKH